MLMLLLGRLPPTGDQDEWENWRFEVVDMDDKLVDKVLASRIPRRSNLRRRRRNGAMTQAGCLDWPQSLRRAGAVRAQRRGLIYLCGTLLLITCGDKAPAIPPLNPATLTVEQQATLAQLNAAGARAFEQRTWEYQRGSGCLLRVTYRLQGKFYRFEDIHLPSMSIKVIDYLAVKGYGVMAYSVEPGKGGSVNLLDTDDKDHALEMAARFKTLQGSCPSSAAPKRD